jgi:hypothetical protein
MQRCKRSMTALTGIDGRFISDLGELDVPRDIEPAIAALRTSLAALNDAQKTIISRYIDADDFPGFEHAGGPGSPIDYAIRGNNTAVNEIDRRHPEARLDPTVFAPPA